MKFIIEKEIFNKIDNLYVGVVVAKSINNSLEYPRISKLLDESIELAKQNFLDKKVKEDERIIPYREAFQKLDINPNKYQCSVEAMFTRISKVKDLPHIKPLVDLIGITREGDIFVPMFSKEEDNPEIGEVVYAVDNNVRTRRWT